MKTIDDVIAKPIVTAPTTVANRSGTAEVPPVGDTKAQEAQTDEAASIQPQAKAAAGGSLGGAVDVLNGLGKNSVPALEFEIDDDRDVVVIKVINRSTGEVIRELPPEAVMEAATRGDGALPALVEASA
ncbi:MAG: flagellar protein FlaG [Pseudomonadota bacterium]